MPTASTYDYVHPVRDAVENFHGNRLSYWHWRKHLMFSAPLAFPFPPDMPFGAVTEQVLPSVYGIHPDWSKIDWSVVEWTLDGTPFQPDPAASLAANGIGHKSVLTFTTPGLDGIGTGS